ncbi:mamu class II histocompatibility antigen, DR alpha chain-like [Genypterus blacodes]|uniref:mamu class II histocompatibility antigen, DR alpha chain-like n=1 Tax=Genypterus blacodes TaxID=154954 RepID=UPI003F75787E
MKINLPLLLLCWALCARANVLHEDINIRGCSDSDGENMYGLDGEEVWYADFINQKAVEPQPEFMDHMTYDGGYEQAQVNLQICRQNMKLRQRALKNETLENDPPPNPTIYSRDDVELGVTNQLICHVSRFYPAPVQIHWTKNGENATQGIRSNPPYVNKDGTFQQFSSLSFVPQLGDIYSCSVEHPALQHPKTSLWDVEKTQPGLGPSIFCVVGLIVGLLGVATGTFFLIKGIECR